MRQCSAPKTSHLINTPNQKQTTPIRKPLPPPTNERAPLPPDLRPQFAPPPFSNTPGEGKRHIAIIEAPRD